MTMARQLWFLLLALRSASVGATSRHVDDLEPARLSCNAAYSAPCARTNAEWLATTTARALANRLDLAPFAEEASNIWANVSHGDYNVETGFYPFVFDKQNGKCVAHGGNPANVGQNLTYIFGRAGIGFSDVHDLFERFRQASNKGGDWVQYLWSDGGSINSKLAFVTNVTDKYLLGVGYENEPLPTDLPCSSKFDSWCSITNARSLVGKAMFLLYQAETLAQFEAAIFDLSFDEDEFQIPGGFYTFMYGYDGQLKSHALLHDYFGETLSQIWQDLDLGTKEEGDLLHEQFILAAEGNEGGWVRYLWRDNPGEPDYEKIAFIAKVEFQGELSYLGVGFTYKSQAVYYDEALINFVPCTDEYNLPCAFRTSLQLSSHALSFAVSTPGPYQQIWDGIKYSEDFRSGAFYLYIYDFNGTCMAHGQVPENAGMTLTEVYAKYNIPLDAEELHDKFRQAAINGGGWVIYDWVVPHIPDSVFQKIAYLFRINIGDRSYYGGVGFNHKQAPVEIHAKNGTKKNGGPVLCSREYGLGCSETNVRSILGQSLAELTLASSEARVTSLQEEDNHFKMDDVLEGITDGVSYFAVNDFYVSVFAVDGTGCGLDDGSGCCIAHGRDSSFVNKTWQQILDKEQITSIPGGSLHEHLISQSNSQSHTRGSGVFEYPWSGEYGNARTKRAVASKYRDGGQNYYVVAEYFKTPLPPTCDSCPAGMECTMPSQSFCKEELPVAGTFLPWIAGMISVFVVSLVFFVWHKRRSRIKRKQMKDKIREMEDQMKGIVEILHNTGVHIDSAETYNEKFGATGIGADQRSSESSAGKVFWCWEEDEGHIRKHSPSSVFMDTNFIRYHSDISDQIELAYQLWKEGRGHRECCIDLTNKVQKVNNPQTGSEYYVDFEAMVQANSSNNYQRAIRREEIVVNQLDSSLANSLPPLPSDIDFFREDGEYFLPTFEGQVIQVSSEHADGKWLYGSVLYDPLLADAREVSEGETAGMKAILSTVLRDRPTTGWFPRTLSRPANAQVMQKLLKSLGGEGMKNLKTPGTWTPGRDGLLKVPEGTNEYHEVSSFFVSALGLHSAHVMVVNVERIQVTQLWQSYAVKKETMKARDAKHPENRVNNTSLDAIERRWLFHGTTPEAIPNIINQGFNRAFAGRNAVAFGKGVYFARDASYSSDTTYSTPDAHGVQRIFLCRVAVGDWCRGSYGQLIPDTKPRNRFELFDSTVDNVKNPSIFVVYHDAQAYPEYIVSFKQIGGSEDC